MPIKKNEKIKQINIQVDPQLKTIWVDSLQIAMRGDGLGLVRLLSNLPEGLSEQIRFMVGKKQLREFVDAICSTINYYPTKIDPSKTAKKDKTSN